MIDTDELFFTILCLLRKYGTENTINIENIRDTKEWVESLDGQPMELAYTAMPDGETINVSLVVGTKAIEEWKRMGFQTATGDA